MINKTIDSKICAGIVTYEPEINRFSDNYNSIIGQVSFVVIVDNGSNNIDEIRNFVHDKKNVYLLENKKNMGIAFALNQIFNFAIDKKQEWVLTLDQDSICSTEIISKYRSFSNLDNIGIYCPRVNYNESNQVQEAVSETLYIEACMTSGSLTLVEAWKICKGFDDWMFIDLVDNDFCMRLKLNNYKVIRINSATINHSLGEQKFINLPFGKRIFFYNHSPLRNYYFVRNSVYFIRKYWNEIDKIHQILVLIYWESKKLIFEGNKFKIINSIIIGIKDGFAKKLK